MKKEKISDIDKHIRFVREFIGTKYKGMDRIAYMEVEAKCRIEKDIPMFYNGKEIGLAKIQDGLIEFYVQDEEFQKIYEEHLLYGTDISIGFKDEKI
jgi:hypothetical protein